MQAAQDACLRCVSPEKSMESLANGCSPRFEG